MSDSVEELVARTYELPGPARGVPSGNRNILQGGVAPPAAGPGPPGCRISAAPTARVPNAVAPALMTPRAGAIRRGKSRLPRDGRCRLLRPILHRRPGSREIGLSRVAVRSGVEERYVATRREGIGMHTLVASNPSCNGRSHLQLERVTAWIDLDVTDERRTQRLDAPVALPAEQLREGAIDCRGAPSSFT
jgi:hypothetical protein